ncbi:MAG: hypothetical protein A3F67_10905 [Verrucomicrobia bacterium RIFCSPHIGHO2_12_FULL_41_10]|nr:MAG: hypothetical protein A3F67_10905 [Verrucomicrobia bacterium RIFCSPHIGHO2_12_FULL_41_10]
MDKKERHLKLVRHQKYLSEIAARKEAKVFKPRQETLFDTVYQSRSPKSSRGLVMGLWQIAMSTKSSFER